MADGYQCALALLNAGLDQSAVQHLTGLRTEAVMALMDALRGEGGGTPVNNLPLEILRRRPFTGDHATKDAAS